jgi:hypothetical protein
MCIQYYIQYSLYIFYSITLATGVVTISLEQIQVPSKSHIAFVIVAPLLIAQRKATQCGADTKKADVIRPVNVLGAQK